MSEKMLVIAFQGARIPNGWHLCDGTDGTPDLSQYFTGERVLIGKSDHE